MKHLGRKFFHLLGGLGLLSLYFLVGRNRALGLYGVLGVLVLAFEVARLRVPAVNRFIYSHFRSFIRENEEHRLTGTVPYILGVGISFWALSTPAAAASVCFLACGDVAATTVGQRFGKTKIGNKSLEGTAAFVVAALLAGFFLSLAGIGLPIWIITLGALVAAGVELLPLPVNDNLTIPVLAGAAMEFALRWVR
jgi:acyl phosphate:glycerol-3-phosphate acyltransferase